MPYCNNCNIPSMRFARLACSQQAGGACTPPASCAGRPFFGRRPVLAIRARGHQRIPTQCPAAQGSSAQELPLLLGGVRVVLVSPKTPANIGAVLRAAENFEAHDVLVVDPRCDPRCEEVRIVSCDSAVFRSLRVAPTLREGLADVSASVGFTRRAGAGRVTHPSLRHLLHHFPDLLPRGGAGGGAGSEPSSSSNSGGASNGAASSGGGGGSSSSSSGSQSSGERLALVFGREESGLTEEELLLCSHACAIPTGRSQPSLNLSHAAAVVLAQLYEARALELGGPDLFEPERAQFVRQEALRLVQQGELEALLSRWAALLERAGISAADSTGGGDRGNHGRRRLAMGHLRSLLLRGRANTMEVRALHGLAKALEAALAERAAK